MRNVILPTDPDQPLQLRPYVDFRDPRQSDPLQPRQYVRLSLMVPAWRLPHTDAAGRVTLTPPIPQ